MHIDFAQAKADGKRLSDLAETTTKEDLRAASNESIDFMLSFIKDLDDAAIVFDPNDANADDPYAVEGEKEIGWSIAHLIAHVTASSEEGAAFSSLLARGVEASERPRYETAWKDITTQAQCVQRIEESRRMRNSYLDTWPDEPNLEVLRQGMSENFQKFTGPLNAIGCFLLGLGHEVGHLDQMADAAKQAGAA